MKKVYVAGAFSANNILDCLKNIGRGNDYSAQIFMRGFAPFCPWHDADYVIRNWNENYTVQMFYDYTMAWLEVSDIVFVVPGWEQSKGTIAEIARANELGIPVVYSFEELDKIANKETNDSDALDEFLFNTATKLKKVGIRRKIVAIRRYLDELIHQDKDEV